eukprot:g917.t1
MSSVFYVYVVPGYSRSRRCNPTVFASGSSLPNKSYNSSDGKPKTTIEDVFRLPKSSPSQSMAVKPPWELSWQMNERNVQWIDDLKIRFIKRIAAHEMKLTDEQFDQKLNLLSNLLPGVNSRIAKMPPKLIAQLIINSHSLGERLLELKLIFPQADVANLVSSRPTLVLTESLQDIQSAADRLHELLPNSNVDHMVEQYPMLLNVESFEEAIRDARRLIPYCNFEQIMQTNPSMILSLQKGKDMIPYDEVPTGS